MTRDTQLNDALNLLEEALRLLDAARAPADIGAHVDLATHRLKALLGSETEKAGELRHLPRSAQG